jgi:hypothetical protein
MVNKLSPWFWHLWKTNCTIDSGCTWTLLVASLHKSFLTHSISFSWMQLQVGNIKKCRLVLPFNCSCSFHYCLLNFSVFLSTIGTSLEPWSLVTWWLFYFWTFECGGWDFELHWAKNYVILELNYPSKFVVCACLSMYLLQTHLKSHLGIVLKVALLPLTHIL